jgi:hypothetical protein
LEYSTIKGYSPVCECKKDVAVSRVVFFGYRARIRGASTPNTKYVLNPIANEYRVGKLKRTLSRDLKEPET